MPFVSKAQRRFLFANEPKVAEKFASETKRFVKLPERVDSKAKERRLNAMRKVASNG